MASEPVPSLQIDPHHVQGLKLVGTVALPSPFPAEGQVFVVRHPAPKEAKGDAAKPTYHVKIVQKLSEVVFDHAVRGPRACSFGPVRPTAGASAETPRPPERVATSRQAAATKEPAEKTDSPPARELSNDDLRKEVEDVSWARTAIAEDDRHALEVELRPRQTGVVFVPEQAPVLLRYECTVTAATSLESILGSAIFCPRTQPCPVACPHR